MKTLVGQNLRWGETEAVQWSSEFNQAEWITESLDDLYEGRVASVVPRGFEAYARILHPFLMRDSSGSHYAKWSELVPGRSHPPRSSSFDEVLAASEDRSLAGDSRPLDGTLSTPLARALSENLSAHVETSELCWFAIWDGFWWQRESQVIPEEVSAGGRLILSQRELYLYSGALEDALVFMPEVEQTPNLWWPDTHAWIVGTDIDLEFTYVGGSEALVNDLLGDGRLEVERAYVEELWNVDRGR